MYFLKLNNITLHYRWQSNQKEITFVFINSLGTDFRIWQNVVRSLKHKGNILTFDKRGHGLSDVSPATKSLNDFADDAEALIHHLKLDRLVIVGLSVGGMIAQILAHRIPERILKLVLCDTHHKIGNDDIWNTRIQQVKEKGLSSISESVMQRWFSDNFRTQNQEQVRGYQNMLERTPAHGYIQTCEAIRDADLSALASRIIIPTLCVVGSEDKSTTPSEVKNLADLIKGSRYEIIDDSGHIPCVDNPQALSKLILDFVN